MPRKTEWIHTIPELLECVTTHRAPYLDRTAVEQLFRVSPRQALRILHRMGAECVGGARVIARETLHARLLQLQQDKEIVFEHTRRENLRRTLEEFRSEARMRRIEIPPVPAAQSLPEAIRLEPGELRISFSSPVELLQQLLLLTEAISSDWEMFQKTGLLETTFHPGAVRLHRAPSA
jgi:CRP-like cAMP-binding protein